MNKLQVNISSLSTDEHSSGVSYSELRQAKPYANRASLDASFSLENAQIGWKIASAGSNSADTIMSQKFYECLQTAIDNLPEVFRIPIMLRETQNLSYEEIAEITGVSSKTVKSRIARARHRLQAELKRYL